MCATQATLAQPVDTTITDLTHLASFEEAAALDIDPAGQLYVVDRGAHSILKLGQNGAVLNQFGGPGQAEGQFDSPSDIDVTNGLVLVIADAGNGRIQRFSREFLFLESLPVYSDEDAAGAIRSGEPAYRQREQSLNGSGTGRPIALVTSPDNQMYAVEEISNVVVKWDQQRNVEQYIGAYDQGAGSLIEPVALAISANGGLFVADRGHASILVYDAFGGFDRSMAQGLCTDARALFAFDDRLLVILRSRILLFQARGTLERTFGIPENELLVDAAIYGDTLYILTEKSLLSTSAAGIVD